MTKLEKVLYTAKAHTTGGRDDGASRSDDAAELAADAEVDLGTIRGGVGLAARLNVSLPGVNHETAQSLVEAASHVCPYSLATSGNIEVKYSVITSKPAARIRETQHA